MVEFEAGFNFLYPISSASAPTAAYAHYALETTEDEHIADLSPRLDKFRNFTGEDT